ncbi:MAG: hypothetical protein JWQ79_1858 [Mucilaginibacter sp.]|nr:hypothetical protein [Mucilaginibacter sp.]
MITLEIYNSINKNYELKSTPLIQYNFTDNEWMPVSILFKKRLNNIDIERLKHANEIIISTDIEKFKIVVRSLDINDYKKKLIITPNHALLLEQSI